MASKDKKVTNSLALFENVNDHSLMELIESLKGKQNKGSRAILAARALRVAVKRGLVKA